jgi:thioredoxin-related protein
MLPGNSRLSALFTAVLVLGALAVPHCRSNGTGGEESPLQWKSYAEAVRNAKESGRPVLIDVFTDWCGWCKKMDRDVYADTSVQRVLSERFELVKLNAESSAVHEIDGERYSEKSIAQGYGVTGYPTTVFLNGQGEAITSVPGYLPKNTFLVVLDYIGTEAYKTVSWKDFQKNHTK